MGSFLISIRGVINNNSFVINSWVARKERKSNTTQAAKHSLHQLRKRRHIGPKYRASPPPKLGFSQTSKWFKNARKTPVEEKMAGGIFRSVKGSGQPVTGSSWKNLTSALQCMQAHCKHFWSSALPSQLHHASGRNLTLLG